MAATGDFDGDRRADLVGERSADRVITMWLSNGTNFGQSTLGQHGAEWVLQR